MDLIAGDIIDGTVTDFGSDGEGVIKLDGYPVFVPCALVGEEVCARIVYVKKDCAFGEVTKIIKPSSSRVKPRCPYFGKCGGCDLQHADTALQREIKRESIRRAIKKFAGLDLDVPAPVRLNDWEYRNKLSLPFAYNARSKRVSLGFYEKRSHKAVPMKWCPLHGEWAAEMIAVLTDWANEFEISVYDENSRKGLLRHAVARMLDALSLTIVINGDKLPHFAELTERLTSTFGKFALYISSNTRADNVIMGDSVRLVSGTEEAQSLGKFKAVVSPKSFLQVNNAVRDALYDGVAKALEGFSGDIVELYSGVGLLTAQLALRMPKASIISVEIEKSASCDAEKLMRSLGISGRVKCVCSDAKLFCKDIESKGRALILDPPRRGCDREVLESATGFDKIVYISCNPQTLARDLNILSKSFEIDSIQPYDMFPQTSNVETLVVLSKKIPDSHINIDVEFGESEGQFSLKKIKERAESRKPKEKVTYKKMQDYIEQTYGFKVHTAYIAEVKRDLGLPMYDAPNAVEELKHPRPHPTPKMVEAIKETLKHFEII